MIAFERGLVAYADRYLLSHSVCPEYAKTLRARVGKFCAWVGCDVSIDDITCDLVNEWLAELEQGGMNKWTLDGYRRGLLSIWNFAYQLGDNDNAPLRLRRVKKPRLIIEAFTHAELRALLTQECWQLC
jgi:site-specific recombinase XerD